jgi:hypothetical protein
MAELLGQRGFGGRDRALHLLDPARRSDRPRAVAEVAFQLTTDRRYGVRQEGRRRVDAVSVGGLDQAQVGDLLEIVRVDALAAVAGGDRAGDRCVQDDHLVEQLLAPRLADTVGLDKQLLGGFGDQLWGVGTADRCDGHGEKPRRVGLRQVASRLNH